VPSPTPVRRPLSTARALAAVVALAGLVAAACTSPESASAVPDGLLALTGSGDSTALTAWDAERTKGTPVDLPDGGTTWISAGRARVLVATMAKGTTATSRPIDLGNDTTWRTIKAKGTTGDSPPGPLAFATWQPGGGRYAALGGDLLSDDPIAVVLIDPSVSTAFDIPVGRDVVAAPPAWIDGDRLVVVTGDAGSPTSAIVDTTNEDVTDGPKGARLIAASANGKRVATMAKQGAPVMVRDMDSWLAGDGTAIGSVAPPEGVSSAISFALDATGQRLAIAWAGDDGKITLAVHAASSDWARVAQPKIPTASGAVVAWMR
jgi:hypothetical protein